MTATVLPMKPQPFDLVKAKEQLDLLAKDKVQDIETDVKLLVVKTPEGQQAAIDLDHDIGSLLKLLEEKEAELLKPADKVIEFAKTVKGIKKAIENRLKVTRVALKEKLKQYLLWEEMQRREQQKKIDEANKQLQAELDKHAAATGVTAPQVTSAPLPKKSSSVVRTESGASSHVRKNWTFRIVNEEQVPREYCSPDPKKIRAAVNSGLRDEVNEDGVVAKSAILGVLIFEDIIPVTK